MATAPTLQARPERTTQLALTILAVILSVGAYALVVLGRTGKAPPDIAAFVGTIAAAFLVAHYAVTRLAPGADPTLLPTAVVLSGLGYAMIYRLDPGRAGDQFGWLMLGIGLFVLTLFVIRDHRTLDRYTYTIGLAGVAFLLLPIAPGLGRTINGARLWIGVGPIVFEPAEIGKVLLVIFLASFLNAKKELLALATRRIGPLHLPELRYMGPLLVAWVVSLVVLFLEKDLGSSLLFFGIFTVMLWTATGRASYLVLGLVLFAIGAFIGYSAFAHVQDRVTVWLHALAPKHIETDGYQIAQGQFAMATGGFVGTGLGKGHPGLIPSVWTDFIFAAFGEELGLFGVTALLLLYVVMVGRGFRAALAREDGFSKLLAAGLTTVIALQTFIIVAGNMRLIPLTGITLPFVSYGGSSLVANFVLLALLVRVSAPPPAHAPTRTRSRPGPADAGASQPTVQTPRGGP